MFLPSLLKKSLVNQTCRRVETIIRSSINNRPYSSGAKTAPSHSTSTSSSTSSSSSSSIKVHRLSNNADLISLSDIGTGYGAGLSLFLPLGSRYQGWKSAGASQMLKRLLVKSNETNSFLYNVRASEIVGAQFSTSLDRENVVLSFGIMKKKIDYAAEILTGALNPSWIPFEKKELADNLTFEWEQANARADFFFTEKLYSLGFKEGGLGYSLVEKPGNVSICQLKSFFNQALTSNKLRFVSVNVKEPEELADYLASQVKNIQFVADESDATIYLDEPAHYRGGNEWHSTVTPYGSCDSLVNVALGYGYCQHCDKKGSSASGALLSADQVAAFILLDAYLETRSNYVPYGNIVGPLAAVGSSPLALVNGGALSLHPDAVHYSLLFRGDDYAMTKDQVLSQLKSVNEALSELGSESYWTAERLTVASTKAQHSLHTQFEEGGRGSSPTLFRLLSLDPSSRDGWNDRLASAANAQNLARHSAILFNAKTQLNYASVGPRTLLPWLSEITEA